MSALVTPARPLPVTIAIRAQVNCTAVIIGKVMSAVHNAPNPNDAPATAYVPMPEGSSSDAHVINPGPRIINKRKSGFDLTVFLDGLLIYVYRGETNKEMAKARVCRGPGSSRESKQQGSLTLVYIGLLLNNPRRSNCSRDETTSSLSVLIQNPQPQFHSSVSTDLIVATNLVVRFSDALDVPKQQENQDNQEDRSYPSAGPISPTSAVRPCRDGSDQQKDQNY